MVNHANIEVTILIQRLVGWILCGAALLVCACSGEVHTTEFWVNDAPHNREAVTESVATVFPEVKGKDLFATNAISPGNAQIRILVSIQKPEWTIYEADILQPGRIANSLQSPESEGEKLLSELASNPAKFVINSGRPNSKEILTLIKDELNSIICQTNTLLRSGSAFTLKEARVHRYADANANSEDGRRLDRLLIEQILPGAIVAMQDDQIVIRLQYSNSKPTNYDEAISNLNLLLTQKCGTNLTVKQYNYRL